MTSEQPEPTRELDLSEIPDPEPDPEPDAAPEAPEAAPEVGDVVAGEPGWSSEDEPPRH